MLTRRLVVCLDVDEGRVRKGVAFRGLRDVGDPPTLARRYEAAGADEIVFLDVGATVASRETLLDTVRRTAATLSIPLTVGGGVRSADDAARTLRAGADKIAVNSAAVARPALIAECAARFGAQCVVASIDARRVGDDWRVVTHGGRRDTPLDARAWALECERLGAGEILLTSIDRDGARDGYDLALTREVAASVSIPIVASGGAGTPAHVAAVLLDTGADAALVAGILHDGVTSVGEIKRALRRAGLAVRMTA